MRALCEKHGVAYGRYGRAEAELVEDRFAGSEQLSFEV